MPSANPFPGANYRRTIAALGAGMVLGAFVGMGIFHRRSGHTPISPAPSVATRRPEPPPATPSMTDLLAAWETADQSGGLPGQELTTLRLAECLAREPVAQWRASLGGTSRPTKDVLHLFAQAVGCLAHQSGVPAALAAQDELIRTAKQRLRFQIQGTGAMDRILSLAPEAVFAYFADPNTAPQKGSGMVLSHLSQAAWFAPEAASTFLVQHAARPALQPYLESLASGMLLMADPHQSARLLSITSESDPWHRALASAVAEGSFPVAEVVRQADVASLTDGLRTAIVGAAVREGPEALQSLMENGSRFAGLEAILFSAVPKTPISADTARWFLAQDASDFASASREVWVQLASALPAEEVAGLCGAGAAAAETGPRQQALADVSLAMEILTDPDAVVDRIARGAPPPSAAALERVSDRLIDPADPAMARLRQSLPAETLGAVLLRHLDDPTLPLPPAHYDALVREYAAAAETAGASPAPGLARAGERLAEEDPEAMARLASELNDHVAARPFVMEGLKVLSQVDPGRFSEQLAEMPAGEARDQLVREWVTHAMDDLEPVVAWARTLADPADQALHLEALAIEAEFRAHSAAARPPGP